jgi:hypothetical protein
MGERYVIVHRSHDPIQTEHLGHILRDAGIAARVIGTRAAALVGVSQNIMPVHLEVPESQAGTATDFLEAYFTGTGQILLEDGDELAEEDAASEQDAAHDHQPLRPLFAAGLAFFLFGFGHAYARRPWTALALACGQAWGVRAFATSTRWAELVTGVVVCATVLLADLVGSQFAVRVHNRGIRRSAASQLGIGAALVAVAIALGAIVGPRIPQPERNRDALALPFGH